MKKVRVKNPKYEFAGAEIYSVSDKGSSSGYPWRVRLSNGEIWKRRGGEAFKFRTVKDAESALYYAKGNSFVKKSKRSKNPTRADISRHASELGKRALRAAGRGAKAVARTGYRASSAAVKAGAQATHREICAKYIRGKNPRAGFEIAAVLRSGYGDALVWTGSGFFAGRKPVEFPNREGARDAANNIVKLFPVQTKKYQIFVRPLGSNARP